MIKNVFKKKMNINWKLILWSINFNDLKANDNAYSNDNNIDLLIKNIL